MHYFSHWIRDIGQFAVTCSPFAMTRPSTTKPCPNTSQFSEEWKVFGVGSCVMHGNAGRKQLLSPSVLAVPRVDRRCEVRHSLHRRCVFDEQPDRGFLFSRSLCRGFTRFWSSESREGKNGNVSGWLSGWLWGRTNGQWSVVSGSVK